MSKYDETTQPGQFKKQGEIIDEEGTPVVKEYSYNPESFTETQMRTGVGSYSDEALTERYEELRKAGALSDQGYDDAMSLEEFIIKERNITPEARAAELREKGKIKSIEPKQTGATFEEAAEQFSEDPASADQQGDLGFSGGNSFPPEFVDALDLMSVGSLSEIIPGSSFPF